MPWAAVGLPIAGARDHGHQLELSMRLRVPQRHVSFVESGRARPSREPLAAWHEELDAPLVLRDEASRQ